MALPSAPDPTEDALPGVLLERLVHPDPARIQSALAGLKASLEERRQERLDMRPLGSGNLAGGLADPAVRGWNWGAFLAGPLWALAHRMYLLALLLLALFWLFPLPNLLLGRYGGQMAWRERRFEDLAEFRAVQRAWALAGLLVLPVQLGLVVGALLYLGG